MCIDERLHDHGSKSSAGGRKDVNEFGSSWTGSEKAQRRMSHSPLSARQIAVDATAACLEKARNPLVKMGVNYWQSLCLQRLFPARDKLTLRGMAPFLPFAVIIAAIENGADYEYRYVGDIQRQAFRTDFKGMRVTQIEAAAPELGALLRGAYEQVRSTGRALLVQGRVEHESQGSLFRYHETAFLPLGISDAAVDHLLIVGVQVPTPFWELPEEKLQRLTKQFVASTALA